jgi:hypothetical protein
MAIAMPAVTLIAELFLLVESPYWLMLRGRKEDARKSLAFLNPNSTAEQLDLAVDTLSYTIAKDAEEHLAVRFPSLVSLIVVTNTNPTPYRQASQTSYLDCFKGVDRRRTWVAVFAPLSQNLTGQNMIGTYGTCEFACRDESPTNHLTKPPRRLL